MITLVVKRYTLIRGDGELVPRRKPKLTHDGGGEWAILKSGDRPGKYHVTGRWNHFYYRSWQSLFLRKRMGLQKIWFEGHPTPFFLGSGMVEERDKALKDTAWSIYNISEYDNPERLMKPRKVDWLILILVGLAALMFGIAVGGRV